MDKMNIMGLMKGAMQMKKMMKETKKKQAKARYSGFAGGNMVEVVVNGLNETINVSISQEAMSEDKETLEVLLAAAMNDAQQKAAKANEETMQSAGQMFGDMGLGDLSGFADKDD